MSNSLYKICNWSTFLSITANMMYNKEQSQVQGVSWKSNEIDIAFW